MLKVLPQIQINMPKNKKTSNGGPLGLAYAIVSFSGLAIIILAVYVITKDSKNAMTVFNIVLPVLASWVATILAFYYGRENFELANQEVRKLVQLTIQQREEELVTSIMRPLSDIVLFQIPAGKGDQDVKLSELSDKFVSDKVSRLPIIDADKKPKYMIHQSGIDKYIAAGNKYDDTLEMFIATQKKAGFEYGLNKGFVVAPEKTTLAAAKRKMEETRPCQDIFITKAGSSDEPLTGWISNIRLAKFLEI
jgi:hypothetical protein